MALDDRQLSALLQAAIDFARGLLEQEGGFLPFAARVMPGGNVEFAQVSGADTAQPIEAIYRMVGGGVAEEARAGSILGAAVVANTRVEGLAEEGFETAMIAMVEAPGFSRSITVPYRLTRADGGPARVELGEMIPEQGEGALFPAFD